MSQFSSDRWSQYEMMDENPWDHALNSMGPYAEDLGVMPGGGVMDQMDIMVDPVNPEGYGGMMSMPSEVGPPDGYDRFGSKQQPFEGPPAPAALGPAGAGAYEPPEPMHGPPEPQHGPPEPQHGPPDQRLVGPPEPQHGPPEPLVGPPAGAAPLEGPPEPMVGPPYEEGPPADWKRIERDRRARMREQYEQRRNEARRRRMSNPRGVQAQAIASNIQRLIDQGMSESEARAIVQQRIGGRQYGKPDEYDRRTRAGIDIAGTVTPRRANFGTATFGGVHDPFRYTSPHSDEYRIRMAKYQLKERLRNRQNVAELGAVPMDATKDPVIRKALDELRLRKGQRDDYLKWFDRLTNSVGVYGDRERGY